MTTKISLILITLLILTHTHQATAYITLTQTRTLLSLSHSLSTRVYHLRTSRGNTEGANRAKLIANKLQFGLGLRFWPTIFAMSWDYLRNYAWRDTMSFTDAIAVASDINELMNSLNELGRFRHDTHRSAWASRNYDHLLKVSKSVSKRLLSVFNKSGPLRELVEALQKEMEGELFMDCLEVDFKDLTSVVEILKDFALKYTTSYPKQDL